MLRYDIGESQDGFTSLARPLVIRSRSGVSRFNFIADVRIWVSVQYFDKIRTGAFNISTKRGEEYGFLVQLDKDCGVEHTMAMERLERPVRRTAAEDPGTSKDIRERPL